MESLGEYWWAILIVWLILTKLNRHAESSKKKKAEKTNRDAEDLVARTLISLTKRVQNQKERDGILVDVAKDIGDDNVFRRALVDGVERILEKPDGKKGFTPVDGSHPLEQLARKATEAETKRRKIVRGIKRGALVAIKVLKGGLA